jgi:hypothetical protein
MHTAPWLGQVTDQPKSTGGVEELAGGFGRGLVMGGMGVGQMIPGDMVTRADVQEQRDLSAGLMDTRMGRLGNLLGTGAFYAPLAYVPGANTAMGSAAIGGGAGLLAPSTSATETTGNVVSGLVGGPMMGRMNRSMARNTGIVANGYEGIAPGLRQGAANWVNQPTSLSAASSMGADISQASPELQQAYKDAINQGLKPRPQVVANHIEADSLPKSINLLEGQASRDPGIYSSQFNNRGRNGLAEIFDKQEQQLKDNLQHMRETVGPDVFTTNNTEHGDTLIKAYKDQDIPIKADIDEKYKALRDAAGGNFPVDGQTFVANARAALDKEMLSDFVSPAFEKQLKKFENNEPMTYQQFESMRTRLAEEMRDHNVSGNQKMAAGIIRQSLEDLPLTGAAADLKPLADAARSAARARFAALEADPAYKAAIENSVPPDKFVQKFVTGGTRDNVALMRQNLTGNDQALQTMGVAAIDDLRNAAKVDAKGNGEFSQKRFNDRLNQQQPLLPHLIPGQERGQLQALGNVARNIKEPPTGSTVNYSNTLSAALSDEATSMATNAALKAADVKLGGAPSLAKKGIEFFTKRHELQKATRPLAGAFEEPK